MKKRLGGFGLGSLKLIHRGPPQKDVKPPPVSIDWLEDDAEEPFAASPLYINRPPPLDPNVEQALRKACSVILQGLRPSGYDIEDTRMKSDELLEHDDDEPLNYNNAPQVKAAAPAPQAQQHKQSQVQRKEVNGYSKASEGPRSVPTDNSKNAHSSAAWVMDRNGDKTAPVNPHDFVVRPEPPARSARRPQVDGNGNGKGDVDDVKRRSIQRGISDLPQEISSPHATREAKESLHVPAPSVSNKSPSPGGPAPPMPALLSPKSPADDNSSSHSRFSDHTESASTNGFSTQLTPSQTKTSTSESQNKRASSPLPPVDADQINQIQTAMARRLRAQEAEMQNHTSAARAVVVPSRNKARTEAVVVSSEVQKPVIVSHRTGSRGKSLTLSSQAAAQAVSDENRAAGPADSAETSRRDAEAPSSAVNGVGAPATEAKPVLNRGGSTDSTDQSAKPNNNIPPVPPIHEGRKGDNGNSTFFRNSDGSLDGSFAKSKDQKLQGIKDKSEEPLQTARARIAANNSSRNSTGPSTSAPQAAQNSSKNSASHSQTASRQAKPSAIAQPQSILKSPTQSTFSISSQNSKHYDDESILVKDFWKPAGNLGKQTRHGSNPLRPRDGKRTDPAAADFDHLMSVMKDNKEVEPRREYQPEIYNGTLAEEPEEEEEETEKMPTSRPVNGNNVTIIEASRSSSRGPISPSLPKSPNTPTFFVNGINGSQTSQSRTQSLTYSRTQSLLSNASQRIAAAVANSQEGHRKSASSPHGQSPYRVVSPTRSSLSGAAPSLYSSMSEPRRPQTGGVRKLFSKFGVGEKKNTWTAPPAPSTIAIWEREMAEEEDPDWDEEACAAPVVGFGKGW